MNDQSLSLAVKPIITYPLEAQVGKTYLMTIDLQPEEGFEWQYREEEYPIYCSVDSVLFISKPVGEPVIVLHRFGGSYGEAKFLLTTILETEKGEINISFINKWGIPTKVLKLTGISTKKDITLEEKLERLNGVSQLDTKIGKCIDRIIEKRKILIPKIRIVHISLNKLYQIVADLNQRYENMQNFEAGQAEQISFTQLTTLIHEELKQVNSLINRCSREYLNIAILGRAREGKSTFIKNLCGLSNHEIPSSEGLPCTAVRSNIFHHNGETEATVKFHSEKTFLNEVIAPYFKYLDLGLPPQTLDEFAFSISHLAREKQNAMQRVVYDHLLNDYYLNLEIYRPLLHKVVHAKQVSCQDISEYVVQKQDSLDRLTNFNHLAVREIDIFCQFERVEFSRIAFVDMPGLGDTRLGNEIEILKTLHDVDLVLFIKRPNLDRYMWEYSDFKLYDLAAQGLHNLQRRAFMILNHTTIHGDNLEACRGMMQSLQVMRFAGCEIADCSKAVETSRVLDKVVIYLEENIVNLETEFAQFTQNRLIELSQALNEVLQNSSSSLQMFPQETQQLLELSDAKNFIIFEENILS